MIISEAELLKVVDRALTGMADILENLGDELGNARPALLGANSPYAIVTHCLGVLDFWVGHCVADRDVVRDRAAEFRATGAVDELVQRVGQARQQVAEDVAGADLDVEVTSDRVHPLMRDGLTRGGAVLHAYEELAQHHGQLEITRDVLRAAAATPPSTSS